MDIVNLCCCKQSEVEDQSLKPNSAVFVFHPTILNYTNGTVRAYDWYQVKQPSNQTARIRWTNFAVLLQF